MKRRWVLRPRGVPATDETRTLGIVMAVEGQVVVHINVGQRFDPEDVSRLRKVLAEAQGVALMDRGEW